jgi:ribosomal protein S12 methylthiotransferase accessory factor
VTDYSDRLCSPEETLRRVAPWLWTYGITRLSRLTTLDNTGIPVWNAVMPNAKSIVINQGKGISDLDAKVSATMEALERAVAGAPRVEAVTASWAGLLEAGNRVDSLPSLVGAGRDDLGKHDRIEWISGIDLIAGGDVFVPFEAVMLDRTRATSRFWQSSDGLASGNSRNEAALHGLLERVERDAHVLWQVTPATKAAERCVDPYSLGDPVVSDLTGRLERAGLRLRLFDITSDIGVPCYTALLAPANILERKEPRYLEVVQGGGAHPDPVRAAIRAITETAQSRLTFISGARDDIDPASFTQPLPETTRLSLSAEPRAAEPREAPTTHGAEALLDSTLARLRQVGITSAIAVSLAGDELPFSVVKMIVPQLENPEGARKRRYGERAISHTLTAF